MMGFRLSRPMVRTAPLPSLAPARKLDETPAADTAEVLHEQLDYLIGHVCPQTCPDCARLERVKSILLGPFSERRYQ